MDGSHEQPWDGQQQQEEDGFEDIEYPPEDLDGGRRPEDYGIYAPNADERNSEQNMAQSQEMSNNPSSSNSNARLKKKQIANRFNSTQNYYSVATFEDLQKNSEMIEEYIDDFDNEPDTGADDEVNSDDEMYKTKKIDCFYKKTAPDEIAKATGSGTVFQTNFGPEMTVKPRGSDPEENLMGTNQIKLEDLDLDNYQNSGSYDGSRTDLDYYRSPNRNGGQPIKDITTYIDDLLNNDDMQKRPWTPPMSNVLSLIDPNKTVNFITPDQSR